MTTRGCVKTLSVKVKLILGLSAIDAILSKGCSPRNIMPIKAKKTIITKKYFWWRFNQSLLKSLKKYHSYKKMKNGFLLSLDAIAAITLLLTVSLFLAGMSFTYSSPELRYQRYYYAGKDLANVLEEAKIGSISDMINRYIIGISDF